MAASCSIIRVPGEDVVNVDPFLAKELVKEKIADYTDIVGLLVLIEGMDTNLWAYIRQRSL